MKTKLFPVVTSLVAVGGLFLALPAQAKDKKPDAALLAKAKLTHDDAEKIALKTVPNATVKGSELEMEDGILRWSFDLNTPGSKAVTEVGVDAVSGKVVENKVEKAEDEAKEEKDEKHEKKEKGEHEDKKD